MIPLLHRPVAELVDAVRQRAVRPEQLIDASREALAEADAGEWPVHALLATDWDGAARRAEGANLGGALAGIPVVVKDNLCTVDLATTCGSRILEGYRSPFDATVVRRLREAGAVVVGKGNLDEFAMGSSTEHSAFGPTRNPLDRARVPGGSSGGSAAAVAAGIAPVALGTDTGGSVRQPAAFCGVVGVKPTYGRASRHGLVAFASSLDQVGVLGRTVADAARMLHVIAGADPLDATTADRPPPAPEARGEVEGLVVGVPEEFFPYTLDARISRLCRAALRRLEARGAEIREVSLPHTAHAIPAYYVIATAEASSNLARFDGVRFGAPRPDAASVEEVYERTRALFGPEVKRRIMLGTYVLSAGYHEQFYARAQRVRDLVAQDFRYLFASGVDIVFTPTTPTTAFGLGERTGDPYGMYLSDVFTVPASLAGLPALSLPVGRVEGLPVGGQLIGRAWEEERLLGVARALEEELAT